MKHQALFSFKEQRKKNVSSAAILPGSLRIKNENAHLSCICSTHSDADA